MGQPILVGMAEIKVVRDPDAVFIGLGLGSCIGLCAYDTLTKIAGMAHVVLPEHHGSDPDLPGKYGNTVVPALMDAMLELGAKIEHIYVAIAGGSSIFNFNGETQRLDIGARNTASVILSLEENSIELAAKHVGGNVGRTVHLFAANGVVRVKTIGQSEMELVKLGVNQLEPQLNAA